MAEAGSRTEVVLDPSFLEGVDSMSIDELRRRRDQALAEREYQSYLRRLIQVRHDIVRAEIERRTGSGEARPLVDRLTTVLSEGPRRGPARGEALSLGPSAADMEEAERRAEEAGGGVLLDDVQALDDHTLEVALAVLTEEERTVSANRAGVLRAHDRLQEELKRRYREDPSLIPSRI